MASRSMPFMCSNVWFTGDVHVCSGQVPSACGRILLIYMFITLVHDGRGVPLLFPLIRPFVLLFDLGGGAHIVVVVGIRQHKTM